MEHRASYVILEGGRARAYHDAFGAVSCALDLLDGPGPCLALVEDLEPTDTLPAENVEGGWLLDLDRRHAIVFGIPRAPDPSVLDEEAAAAIGAAIEALESDPAAYLRQLAPAWSGWTLVWDPRGVAAFAEHLAGRGLSGFGSPPPSGDGPRAEHRAD